MSISPVESVTAATSWGEFESWVQSLQAERTRRREAREVYVSELIFRGQADASWPLQTTLERTYPDRCGVLDYYTCAFAAKNSIEAHTGKRWDIQSPLDYASEVNGRRRSSPIGTSQTWEYLAYLRHHGFPSPLLDWSASPYVAAFFAYASATRETEQVAVFALLEHAGEGKGGWAGDPDITTLGHYITADRRHHSQRSQYTHCTQLQDDRLWYVPHDMVLGPHRAEEQDLLWKISLPGRDRERVLRHLDQYNLNAYSLFGSEDALMETSAFREFQAGR
jgi:hypothetical protein